MEATQLDRVYNRWTVLGSSCKVHVVQGDNSGVATNHALIPYPGTSNVFSATDVIRAGTASKAKQIMVIKGDNSRNSIINGGYHSSAEMEGVPQSTIMSYSNYTGSGSTDPSNYFTWIIGVQAADVATTTSGWYKFELVYYVKYWARVVDPAQ